MSIRISDSATSDLRVRKTYQALLDALETLLEKQSYETISISALCNEAQVRRTTFYKHFQNKDDFALFAIRTVHKEFVLRLPQKSIDSSLEFVTGMSRQLVTFLNSHDKLTDSLLASSVANQLIDVLCEQISMDIVNGLQADQSLRTRKDDSASSMAIQLRADFCAGGIMKIFKTWVENGRTTPAPDDLIEQVPILIRNCLLENAEQSTFDRYRG